MSWETDPWLAFDTETTGINPETARIVTAAVVNIRDGTYAATRWLVNPGVDIPVEATEIHGVTTEHARSNGQDPDDAVLEVASRLAEHGMLGLPIVAMNAPYDLTVLDRELRRHDLGQLAVDECRPILDPWVIDRAMDRYRPGKRTLADLCWHYGVTHDGAHDAAEDAVAAARVMWKILQRYPGLTKMRLDEIHDAQVRWHAESSAGLVTWMRERAAKLDDPQERAALLAKAAGVRGDWPVIPWTKQP